MVKFARIGLASITFLGTYLFSYWLVYAPLLFNISMWLPTVAALATAWFAASWAWRKLPEMDKQGVLGRMGLWGIIAGAIGFCGGFFGPIFFAPEANQGPLLGIFITGPLGLIGGAVAGLTYSLWKKY